MGSTVSVTPFRDIGLLFDCRPWRAAVTRLQTEVSLYIYIDVEFEASRP